MTVNTHKISLKTLILATIAGGVFVFASTPAAAAGDYFSAQVETGQQQNANRTIGNTYKVNIKYKSPTALKLAYGRHYGKFRVEGELGYAKSDIKEYETSNTEPSVASGHEEYYSLMVNGLMDFKNTTQFTPYLGAGIGTVDIHHKATFRPRAITGTRVLVTDHYTWVLGYQAMAGVNWQVKPKMAVSLNYRYFATNGHTHTQSGSSYTDFDVESAKINFIGLGLNYSF